MISKTSQDLIGFNVNNVGCYNVINVVNIINVVNAKRNNIINVNNVKRDNVINIVLSVPCNFYVELMFTYIMYIFKH